MVTYAELHKLKSGDLISRKQKAQTEETDLGVCVLSARSFLIPLEEYTNSFRDNQPGSFKVHAGVTF